MKKQLTKKQNSIVINACVQLIDRIFQQKRIMAKIANMRSPETLRSKFIGSSYFTRKQVQLLFNSLVLLKTGYKAELTAFLSSRGIKNVGVIIRLIRIEKSLLQVIIRDLKDILDSK